MPFATPARSTAQNSLPAVLPLTAITDTLPPPPAQTRGWEPSPVTAKALPHPRKQKGATAIEYGLIVGLIAAVIIAVLMTTGTNLNTLFTSVESALP